MKNFTDLINEADGARITSDYSRYLLEKQYFISRETARILLEEEDDDGDDTQSTPFSRPFRGQQIYVHLDVDGRREIKVVNSLDQAKRLAKNFDTAVAYDNGGDELNLRESSEDGSDRSYTDNFKAAPLPKRTKSPLSASMPKTYETLRAKLEKDIESNISEITKQEEDIVGKGNASAESVKNSALWKAVYDDPSLASVLDVEEYEKSGFKTDDPLHIRRIGSHTYVPSREMTLADIKPSSREYAAGTAEGPVNPEDVPDIKFITPAHKSFETKSGMEQFGTKAGRWFENPENIKTTLSMGIGLGAGVGAARGLLSAVPKVGPALAPWLIGAGEVSLAGLYGYNVANRIQSEIEQAKKGKSVTTQAATWGEVAGEVGAGLPGSIVGGSMVAPRTPRPSQAVEPPKAPKTQEPEVRSSESWRIPTRDYSTILRRQREPFTGDSAFEPPSVALLRDLPTKFGRESALAAKFKVGKDKVSMADMTPGEKINMWRNLLGYGPKGATNKIPTAPWEKYALTNPLEAKPESFAEPTTPLAPQTPEAGTAITLPKGFKGPQQPFKGFSFTPPAQLPKRPADFESPKDYQKAKEEELGRQLNDQEVKASAEEYSKDVRAKEAAKTPDRSLLFKDKGPVALTSVGAPSRASILTKIQQSPVAKAAGIAASIPTAADMAAKEAGSIPAIVAKALETSGKPSEAPGILRTAYKETKLAEPKAEVPKPEVIPTSASKPTVGAKPTSISFGVSGAPTTDVGTRMPPPNIQIDQTPEDRSMDAIEAARLAATTKAGKQSEVSSAKDRTVQVKSDEVKKEKETKIPDATKTIDVSQLTKDILAAVAATAAGTSLARSNIKRSTQLKNTIPPEAAGGVLPGDGADFAVSPAEQAKVGSGTENWDLLLKNIYGKYAGTLSK